MLSIVIPTLDRSETLDRTLSGIVECEAPDNGFEVIVVNNGTSDATAAVISRHAESPLVVAVDHPEGGPAAARNAGIRVAKGEVILFLGDDTIPGEPTTLRRHADLHAARPEDTYAVLGRIAWDPAKPVTQFMNWLDTGGTQFDYWRLEAGVVPAEDHFYSSHLSLKKAILDSVGGFDERFPAAAIEDTELGARLAGAGLELEYHPKLLVLHDHPTTLGQSLDRVQRVGRIGALYNRLFPSRPHPGIGRADGVKGAVVTALGPVLWIAEKLPLPLRARRRLWWAMHRSAYARGYRIGPPKGST